MGTGASKQTVGVPSNPRVQYSQGLAKREKKEILVDAPVLVDMEHGTVRYRESKRWDKGKNMKGKELPFEKESVKDLDKKDHYFYHARLNQYGPEASKEKEDRFKFFYVMKGPNSAHHKKVFYVYGQGWNAQDGRRVKPTESVGMGNDYAWSSSVNPNGLYYSMEFDNPTEQPKQVLSDEDRMLEDLQSSPNKATLQFSLSAEERVSSLKARLSVKLLKSVQNIHVAFNNRELRDEDVIGDLRTNSELENEELSENFSITLTLVT